MTARTCTHQACDCPVTGDDIYCSDFCKEAVRQNPGSKEHCDCGHPHCKAPSASEIRRG